jgi:hypothetical protein
MDGMSAAKVWTSAAAGAVMTATWTKMPQDLATMVLLTLATTECGSMTGSVWR